MEDVFAGGKQQESVWNAQDYMGKKLTYQQWDVDAAAKTAKQSFQTKDIRVWIGDVKQYLADVYPLCVNNIPEADRIWNELEAAYNETFESGFRTDTRRKRMLVLAVDRLYANINRAVAPARYFFAFNVRRNKQQAVDDYVRKFKPKEERGEE